MKQSLQKTQRISKQNGRVMIAVAVFFDVIPALLIVAILGLGVFFVMNSGVVQDYNTLKRGDEIRNDPTIPWYKKAPMGFAAMWGVTTKGASFLAGSALAIIIIPFVYTIGSFASTFMAYLLFTVWFLYKGVNIWSITNTKKLLTTVITLVIENIPLVDLLPGTTIMVWRQVKATQIEDRVKNEAIKTQIEQSMSRRTRARRPMYAPA